MQNYTINKYGINFCVDYYVELLGVISILCEDQEAIFEAGEIRCNEKYVNEVKEYFRNTDYKRITKTLEMLSDEYLFNCDAPVWVMLKLSNNSEITKIDKDELFRDRKEIPDEVFDDFINEIKTFEIESNFKEFYNAHLDIYGKIINNYLRDYEKYEALEFLLGFLNEEPTNEYYINFMLGITNGNYGATIDNKVYSNNRPYYKTRYNDLPDYSFDDIYSSTLIAHEFAHSFINVLVAKYREEIRKIDIKKYEKELKELCYGDSIETLIDEHIIRAIECLYVKTKFSKVYDKYVEYNIEDGYTKLEEVIEVISSKFNMHEIIELFY